VEKNTNNQSVKIRDNQWRSALLIRGGRVIDPSQGLDAERDVLLRDGLVAEIAAPGKIAADGVEVFEAHGFVVAPGFIDLHVHLREPGQTYKETIRTGTAAAAAGGFTAVCAMPNTTPVNDSPETTEWMQAPARQAVVKVYPVAAATMGSNGHQLTNFAELKGVGAVGVTDDGHPILDDAVMQKALAAAAKVGFPVMQHAEDTRMTAKAQVNAGPTAFRLGLRGMPTDAEALVVERDVRLAEKTGGHLHVCHLSAARALDAIRDAKARNLHVTCEVTPHHFTLIDEDLDNGPTPYDTRLKMNPPLRSHQDRDALIAGIADGTVDAIATDHAPHAAHEKSVEFDRAPFGIIGLETAVPLAITVLHGQHKIPLARIVELFSTKPAKIIGLANRGTLKLGAHADVTMFDPEAKWSYDPSQSRSKSRNTPFEGWNFTGKVVATIIGGETVYRS